MFAGEDEDPAVEDGDDFKGILPPMPSGSKIRIPPELMPDDATIMHYFELYFTNVHPYVPVLNKTQLYNQWHTNRESISPLLLEAIFAVAGRLADEPAQGQQWIALASSKNQSYHFYPCFKLTKSRTCRFLHGRTTLEYPSSSLNHLESQGSFAETWLLLPILDVYCALRRHG